MKKLTVIFIGVFFACRVIGQQDMGYSHNMFNQMTVNPGYAGSMDMFCFHLLQRNQWMGIVNSGAPMSTVFSVNTPFTLFEKSHGAGLTFIRNTVAFNTDQSIKLSYAYRSKVKFGDGMVGLGISFGLINSKIDFSKISSSLDAGNDQTLSGLSNSKPNNLLDLGLGIYYKTEKLYMGISGTHLLPTDYNFSGQGNIAYYMVPHFYVTAGYNYQLSNPMLELVPSFYIQSIGTTTTINFNTNLVYNNRIWGGLSYRAGAALSGLFGIELLPGVRFGVAYDYETSDISKVSSGSLEVTVLYCFKLKKEKMPQRYKSIRFL